MKRCSCFLQRGLTLLELSVVLLVLIALAGLMVPYVVGTGQMAMCRATDASMTVVKEAIMGGSAGPGYYMDTLGHYPSPKDNPDHKYGLHYLFVAGGRDKYNPKTAVGLRDPYLSTGGRSTDQYHASFGAVFDSSSNPNGTVHIDHNDLDLDLYHVFDAWGRPIVLQVPIDTSDSEDPFKYARLVSAGPGHGLGPKDAAIDTTISNLDASDRNDDRVLYLRMPDPGRNEPCDNY
ncbi:MULTISPECIES: hypothetical protein [Methylotuvimicrobium]|uniref:Prepilin-type N-terminal cleavage/methylation domain-containing protein n=2 Tax=Methylotuvimicrobium TaxID=2822410 RepID=G4SYH8_META2|nr:MULTISPECIES: hypothetical protein [Methylotuvimicrobium]QCW84169.1 hypothetical protein EQU24_19455 [Methylotuvimicrobium buryatense]CCE22182.1 protein of unknown function [Methylotuvimicrobium alcaliphilum 20Z]